MGTEQVPVFSAAPREVCFCSEHHRVLHSVLQSDRHKQTDRAAGGFSRGARIAFAVRHNWINRAVKKWQKTFSFFHHSGAKVGFCQRDKGTKQARLQLRDGLLHCRQILQAFILNDASNSRFDQLILLLADDTLLSLHTDGQ